MNIAGTALLGGTLDVELLVTFSPAPGSNFFVLTSTLGDSGRFSSVVFTGAPLPSGETWNVVYNPNNVELQVSTVPEPSSILLFATGIAMFAVLLRYRKTVWSRQ